MNSACWSWTRRQVDAQEEAGARPGPRSQAATCSQASAMTQRPSVRIRPFSSASGMNSSGETRPRVGWRQRTRASTPAIAARVELDDRLVEDRELAAADAPFQLGREGVAGDDRRVHRRLEDRDAALAGCLGGVHRDVGVAQQLVGVLADPAADGDADAAADRDLLALDRERDLQRVDHALRDRERAVELDLVRQQEANSSPPSRAARSSVRTQPGCARRQRPAAGRRPRGRACR